jgi:hypothetical protein
MPKKYIEIEGAKGRQGNQTPEPVSSVTLLEIRSKDLPVVPSLNILIKLAEHHFTCDCSFDGGRDWDNWYTMVPFVFMIASTYVVYYYFWREFMDLHCSRSDKTTGKGRHKPSQAQLPPGKWATLSEVKDEKA